MSKDPAKKSGPVKRYVIKPLIWIVGILLVLTLITLIFINPILKFGIEKIGSAIAGVDMKVEAIRVSPLQGRVEIRELIISNPSDKGYASEYAIRLGHVDADIVPSTLVCGPKTVVEDVTLKDIIIHYETGLLLNSNLQDILDNLNRLSGKSDKKDDKKKEESPGRNLQVDHFVMENVGLYIIAKGTTKTGAGIPLTIPDIGPLGTNPEGITPAELCIDALTEILLCASKQAGIKVSDSVMKAGADLTEGGKAAMDKTMGGLKGLFGGSKQEEAAKDATQK